MTRRSATPPTTAPAIMLALGDVFDVPVAATTPEPVPAEPELVEPEPVEPEPTEPVPMLNGLVVEDAEEEVTTVPSGTVYLQWDH